MKYQVFTYSVPCEQGVQELNAFLSSHRILRVRDEVVVKGSDPYLLFVVEYLDRPGGEKATKPPKVDYREVLTDEEFAVFSALRDWRKACAEEEGVPVYTVFTNAQLAEIVKNKVETLAELGKVDGVGKSRVEKYGEALLNTFKDFAHPRMRRNGCGAAALECSGLTELLNGCAWVFESAVKPAHSKGRCKYETPWLSVRAHRRTGKPAGGLPCHAEGEAGSVGSPAVSRKPAWKH